jgi:hypothetical protein
MSFFRIFFIDQDIYLVRFNTYIIFVETELYEVIRFNPVELCGLTNDLMVDQ